MCFKTEEKILFNFKHNINHQKKLTSKKAWKQTLLLEKMTKPLMF
jgi:hypothetical protein